MQNDQKSKAYAVVFRFVKENLWLFGLGLLCSMLNTAFNSLTPQIIRMTVDSIIGSEELPGWFTALGLQRLLQGDTARVLLLAAAAVLAAAILSGVFSFLARINTARASENAIKSLRDALYGHIQKLPFSWHTAHQTGEIIQRCTSDVEVIRNFVSAQMVEVFRIVFLIVMTMAIMFSMNVKISLVVAVFIPIIALYSFFFSSKISKRFMDADIAEGKLSSTVQENLTGVRVVRAFGRENFEIERFDERNNHFADLWIRLGHMMTTYWSTGDFIMALQVLTVICVGTVSAVHGEITLGEFLAFVSYNATLTWPVRSLGKILAEMSKTGVSLERVSYILLAEPEHQAIQNWYRDLLHLYKKNKAMYELDNDPAGFEWVNADDCFRSIYSFIRHSKDNKKNLLFVLNFTPMERRDYRVGVPRRKQCRLILNSDDVQYGGKGEPRPLLYKPVKQECDGKKYSFAYPLAPYGVAVFEF